MQILKLISSLFLSFTSLFAPPPTPTPTPYPALPSATPTYQTTTYINAAGGYQFDYPANTEVTTYDDGIAGISKLTIRIDPFSIAPSLTATELLTEDLMCSADGPTGSISCKNTAARPFTNTKGVIGYLVKRDKDYNGTLLKDWAYVFPRKTSSGQDMILSVEEPNASRLEVLDQIASSFAWQ